MGSKNNPGKFDCYSRAEPDEPVFVLLGRDPVAHVVVEDWAALREELGRTEPEVLEEARDCARQMFEWAAQKRKLDQALAASELRVAAIQAWRQQGADRERHRLRDVIDLLFLAPVDLAPETEQEPNARIHELEAMCRRAADVISEQVSINVADGGLRGRQELDDLVKELRVA
jgi:hypothetical protein